MQNPREDNYYVRLHKRSFALLINLLMLFQAFYYCKIDGLSKRNFLSILIPILSTLDIFKITICEFFTLFRCFVWELFGLFRCLCCSFYFNLIHFLSVYCCYFCSKKKKMNDFVVEEVDVARTNQRILSIINEIKVIPTSVKFKENISHLKEAVDNKYKEVYSSS